MAPQSLENTVQTSKLCSQGIRNLTGASLSPPAPTPAKPNYLHLPEHALLVTHSTLHILSPYFQCPIPIKSFCEFLVLSQQNLSLSLLCYIKECLHFFIFITPWISFLLWLQQSASNLVPSNNTKLFSHNFGGQKSAVESYRAKIKVLAGWVPSRGSRGESAPCLSQLLDSANIPWLVSASPQTLLLLSHCFLLQ